MSSLIFQYRTKFYLGSISQADSPVERSDNVADDEKAHGGDEEVVEVEPLKAMRQITRQEQVRNYLIGCIGLLYNETVKVMENGSDV